MTESQESFLGAVSTSQPSQESFRGGSDAGGGIDSAAFLQQDNDNDKDKGKDNDKGKDKDKDKDKDEDKDKINKRPYMCYIFEKLRVQGY